VNPLGRKLPEDDADQTGFTLSDEVAFRETRLTKWRRSLSLVEGDRILAT